VVSKIKGDSRESVPWALKRRSILAAYWHE
jgi:hypothetical protein